MFKIVLMIFIATLMSANAGNYNVKFKGITLGQIDTLDTLKSNYLKAKVTNSIAKFFIRKKYYIFHSNEEPDIKDAKFKKDKNMVLFAFLQSITQKPKHKIYKINELKTMTIDCNDGACKFIYNSSGRIKGRGIVTFDKKGEFVKLEEEISTIEISKI